MIIITKIRKKNINMKEINKNTQPINIAKIIKDDAKIHGLNNLQRTSENKKRLHGKYALQSNAEDVHRQNLSVTEEYKTKSRDVVINISCTGPNTIYLANIIKNSADLITT